MLFMFPVWRRKSVRLSESSFDIDELLHNWSILILDLWKKYRARVNQCIGSSSKSTAWILTRAQTSAIVLTFNPTSLNHLNLNTTTKYNHLMVRCRLPNMRELRGTSELPTLYQCFIWQILAVDGCEQDNTVIAANSNSYEWSYVIVVNGSKTLRQYINGIHNVCFP